MKTVAYAPATDTLLLSRRSVLVDYTVVFGDDENEVVACSKRITVVEDTDFSQLPETTRTTIQNLYRDIYGKGRE